VKSLEKILGGEYPDNVYSELKERLKREAGISSIGD